MNSIMLALRLFSSALLFVPAFKPVDKASNIKFTIRNMGFQVSGSFTGLAGDLRFDPKNLQESRFNLTAQANTVSTGIGKRDRDLKKEEYLNSNKYPELKFSSASIEAAPQQDHFFVSGAITIKGVTKELSFPFTAVKQADGYLFAGKFRINRRDFGVGGNSLIMSDELDIFFSIVGKG